ncbi:3D domain-containing protein [Arenibacter echinorum]|uniref:3D (Asp-Asp-Asp) domain-containing protein n=1 Tax=Arenibacter echinorum TaxID=440515 RepID=A0A327RFZ1_9FLAO|nr:3D domain-containing protein [Arenibacter echinorum]RAJ12727.1 3D (Asp-Asp-Asp) domain-containing protein [Arenibacter echinorum]
MNKYIGKFGLNSRHLTLWIVLPGILFSLATCKEKVVDDGYIWKKLRVTATAYNSFPSQTSKIHPGITAWGDSLKPGMKIIAVSKDLTPLGLDYNTHVKIKGDTSIYLVKDKMHSKWKNRIDIYMGEDKEKALQWGRKKITIHYRVKRDSTEIK